MHLEMKHMISSDIVLETLLEEIGNTMVQSKASLKNRDILRNLSTFTPVLPNATRWTGNYRMLKQFNRMRDQLITASRMEGSTLTLNESTQFRNLALKYERMMAELNDVTLMLQKDKATLSDCRLIVDELMGMVDRYKNIEDSRFFECHLKSTYLGENADIVEHPSFESGEPRFRETKQATCL